MALETPNPRRKKRKISLKGQVLPILIGIVPIFLVMGLLTRGGAGLHRGVLIFWSVAIVGALISVAYHIVYRASIPKSVIYAPSFWKTLPISTLVFMVGMVNAWGASASWSLQLTPNKLERPGAWVQLLAKLLLREPTAGTQVAARFHSWVTGPQFLGGALWGAVGYACIFGLAGMLSSLARREAFDPRQEPFGTAGFWPFLRALIGYFYGWALGFGFGGVLIWVLTFFTGGLSPMPAALTTFKAALGAVGDPNRAFAAAFVAGAWMLALAMIFLGQGDFTVAFSDPKAEEKEPPMKVTLPELPKTEPPNLDFAAVSAETEQIAVSFGRDLQSTVRQMGLGEDAGVVFEVPQTEVAEVPSEPTTANVLSARKPEFDTSFDEAFGQLAHVHIQITAQLGQMQISLAEWLTLEEGSLLEIPRATDGTVAICLNGKAVGRAKAAVLENHVAIKVMRLEPGTVDALKGA